ncbi:DUF4105 domain-containing protein [Photobacterium sp. GJ3]|uniref:Lnb N-terminal periplasmic domain-containing protein n=1 Tax=Photobacterium sp. GJ3 TaxID=2829502 RepID=UPI001B8D81DD|nr:DUF4105 domain-containing protein [Photobacterium sp. GJ3]QUJ66425.1 DUF4105 domain-containing protein [Photobacterium sp. GJ3]
MQFDKQLMLRSLLGASFFWFASIQPTLAGSAVSAGIISSDAAAIAQFSALLHVSDHSLNIQDDDFYFSSDPTNIQAEIEANLAQVTNPEHTQDYICRFPARAQWLSEHSTQVSPPDFSRCPDLQAFLDAVSAKNISLTYASENLMSPSSFMGHTFLKLSDNENNPGHAVSFFTEVDGFNLPKIMFDSLVVGKEGYFIVSPYRESLSFYKNIEGRNVFEYQLAMSDKNKQLIQLHLWELKDTRIDYFFHNQNCASITLNILAIANPDLMEHRRDWLSPLDMIQLAQRHHMIQQTSITPSTGWKLRAYGASQQDETKQSLLAQLIAGHLKTRFNDPQISAGEQFLTWEFAQAMNQYLLENEDISQEIYAENTAKLTAYDTEFASYAVDLSEFKNPINRNKDAQWHLGTRWSNTGEPHLTATWLPASHTLTDDNRNAFSESSLELMKISVSADQNSFNLDNFTLYGIQSYLPYDPLFGGLSGKFSIQWDRGTDFSERENKRFFFSGGLGLSYPINHAMLTYATVDTELSFNTDIAWGAIGVDMGLISYFRHDVKMNLSASTVWNQYASSNFRHQAAVTLSYLGFTDSAVDLRAQYNEMDGLREGQIRAIYRHYY